MYKAEPAHLRHLKTTELKADLVVVGGGMAGVCCAITAARAGIQVVVVQDRPVLGGNASSEVRLWVLGATSHLGNNNRWSREGGVIDEILVENLYRNREGNPIIFDALLLEKVVAEPRITLLLNTAVHDLSKSGADRIASVRAFCSQTSTCYEISAPLFCDGSGDGIVGFLAGAAFRMGAESNLEFGERFAPSEEYGQLLGHSIYFYTKDTGAPVRFIPPSFALKNIPSAIPRFQSFNTREYGCRLWWIEFGGRKDTIHDTEEIKWELWKIVYGVWDYIKNSGNFPEAQSLTLEWVGTIPGKRESRRFEGDYMLRQQDIVEQREHPDAVSYGGWSIDLHPADGVFSERPGCNQWHSKGVYQIPYRCMYSRNITNLFLAGRIISATHVAFGSTRVMATCAHGGQAVGMAAALCRRLQVQPRDLEHQPLINQLQRELIHSGQYIPGVVQHDPADLVRTARISASSELQLATLPPTGPMLRLESGWAMILPLQPGLVPAFRFKVSATAATMLRAELRVSSKPLNYTPDVTLDTREVQLVQGDLQSVVVEFAAAIDQPRYSFVCLMANPVVSVCTSAMRVTGVVAATDRFNAAVGRGSAQTPPPDIGVDGFEFWRPQRRPAGQNIAMTITPPLSAFAAVNIASGAVAPAAGSNAWVADPADPRPRLTLQWDMAQTIRRIELSFDCDFDHPVESVLMGHPEHVMPFCVRRCRILDGAGNVAAECNDNHLTRRTIRLPSPVLTDRLVLELEHPDEQVPAALFQCAVYGD